MRVNAAIVASLTGAALAYPVLESYKEVKEVQAYGVDSQAHAYTAPVYGDKPSHSSHPPATKYKQEDKYEHKDEHAPKYKHEETKQEKPKETPVKQKETKDDCITKRSLLGLDLSACNNVGVDGSVGESEQEKPKETPSKQKETKDDCIAKRSLLGLDLSACNNADVNGSVGQSEQEKPKEKETPSKQKETKDDCIAKRNLLGLDLSACNNADVDGSVGQSDQEKPKEKETPSKQKETKDDCIAKRNLLGLDLSACNDADVDGSVGQSESKGEASPKEPSAPKAATDEKETEDDCMTKRALGLDLSACNNDDVDGSLGQSKDKATSKGPSALKDLMDEFDPQEPQGPNTIDPTRIIDTDKITDVTKVLNKPVDLLPIGDAASGSNDKEVTDSSLELPVGKNLKQLLPSGKESDATDPESDPLTAVTSAAQQLQKSGIIPRRHAREIRPTLNAAGNTKSALATGKGSLAQREALQLLGEGEDSKLASFLDDSGIAPLRINGNVDNAVQGSASASSVPVRREIDVSRLLGDFNAEADGQLTTSTSAAMGMDKDAEDAEMVKRQPELAALMDLLGPLAGGPLTGPSPAKAGAPAKREAQHDLLALMKLLGPVTGAPPAKSCGTAAKREAELSLDAVTGILKPLTGGKEAGAAGAPAKREAELSLDAVTGILKPLTGGKEAGAAGAPAKRQLGLDAVTGMLAPVTGAAAPGAPVKRDSPYSEHSVPAKEEPYGKYSEEKVENDYSSVHESANIYTGSEEKEQFDPIAPQNPQYHGSSDIVEKTQPFDYVESIEPVY